LFQRAVELKRAAPGDNRENVLISLNKLSESQAQLGDLSRAITTQEEVVALAADVMGTDARQYSMWLNNLANMQADVGELESAASSMREALEIARRVLGEDDAGVATPLNNLASILYDLGECDAAIPLHEESIALRRRHHGEPSAEVAIALGNYALALSCVGRHADAEVAAAEAVPMAATVFGSEHQRTAAARLTLVRIFLETNRAEAAEPLAREAILALSAVNARHWRTGTARAHLGDALIALHRGAEGVIELEAAYDILLETMAADIPRLRTLADRIADYYEAEGELALASDWRLRASGASGE
jgi:tetratricopeptide (TPR) repeat protein